MCRKLMILLSAAVWSFGAFHGSGLAARKPNEAAAKSEKREQRMHPYRVLVVIGDQWKDPVSYTISMRKGEPEFCNVVNMLKVSGIPFDISGSISSDCK